MSPLGGKDSEPLRDQVLGARLMGAPASIQRLYLIYAVSPVEGTAFNLVLDRVFAKRMIGVEASSARPDRA